MSGSKGDAGPEVAARIEAGLRKFPDFPRPGILFRDVSTLLMNPELLQETNRELSRLCEEHSSGATFVCGMEARGFLFGPPIAVSLGKGFVMMRKPNKLPGEKLSIDYGLEYGKDVLQMHQFEEFKGAKFIVVDDLLATGGTALAAAKLIQQAGGSVQAYAFVVELEDCKGREKIAEWHAANDLPSPNFHCLLSC